MENKLIRRRNNVLCPVGMPLRGRNKTGVLRLWFVGGLVTLGFSDINMPHMDLALL